MYNFFLLSNVALYLITKKMKQLFMEHKNLLHSKPAPYLERIFLEHKKPAPKKTAPRKKEIFNRELACLKFEITI